MDERSSGRAYAGAGGVVLRSVETRVAWLICLAALCVCRPACAAGKKGDFLQTDTLGVSLVTRDMTTRTTRTVGDATNLSEFVGLHYYVAQRVRLGMNLQLTERLVPDPPASQGRIQRFAFLPQVGWNFYDPFFTALVFGIAPRSEGKAQLNLTVQAVFGVSVPVSRHVSLSAALEVPWGYYPHQTVGLTALAGVAFRF
jgi:hypothetical protein